MFKTITSWALAGLMMTALVGCGAAEQAGDEMTDMVKDGADATKEMVDDAAMEMKEAMPSE